MSNTLYLLIAGSRDYDNYEEFSDILESTIERIPHDDIEIVSGGARGADRLAERYAEEHGLIMRVFYADWETDGKRAGILRNIKMQNYIKDKPNRACLCFWDGESRGTQSNFKMATERNTPLYVYNYTTRHMNVRKNLEENDFGVHV